VESTSVEVVSRGSSVVAYSSALVVRNSVSVVVGSSWVGCSGVGSTLLVADSVLLVVHRSARELDEVEHSASGVAVTTTTSTVVLVTVPIGVSSPQPTLDSVVVPFIQ
jgi:hypothetical protein